MSLFVYVYLIDQGSQSGAFAVTGGAGNEDQSLGQIELVRKRFRQCQLFQGLNFFRYASKDCAASILLNKGVHTEATKAADRITTIKIPILEKGLSLIL
jgi:hypothetical protein